MSVLRNRLMCAAVACGALVTTACDELLDVNNPNNLEADAIDEERDRTLLSQSAYQAFVSRYGNIAVHSAWFTNEARVGDTFPTRNEFGRRDIPPNGDQGGIWNGLHNSIQFGEETARRIEAAGPTLDLARAYFTSGFAMIFVGELFCEGTVAENWVKPRGPITSAQMLDSAIVRLQKAHDLAKALTGTEATNIVNAAIVGMARAHLQNGRKAQASQLAATVPANFTYNLLHMDDPSNRNLGNTVWSFSEARISLVVGPEYRAMADGGDPRISYTDMKRPAQDGVQNFFRQAKYKGWADNERIASGLEAQYIKVEADGNAADMLAFINARRAVGKQTPLAATTDMAVLMIELMDQKSRDFWLELKRQGDFRRNGDRVPNIMQPGNNYYKPSLGLVSTQTCWPIPQTEIDNNEFWPKNK